MDWGPGLACQRKLSLLRTVAGADFESEFSRVSDQQIASRPCCGGVPRSRQSRQVCGCSRAQCARTPAHRGRHPPAQPVPLPPLKERPSVPSSAAGRGLSCRMWSPLHEIVELSCAAFVALASSAVRATQGFAWLAEANGAGTRFMQEDALATAWLAATSIDLSGAARRCVHRETCGHIASACVPAAGSSSCTLGFASLPASCQQASGSTRLGSSRSGGSSRPACSGLLCVCAPSDAALVVLWGTSRP